MPADIIREVASNVSFIKREKLDKGVEYFREAIDDTSEKFGMGVVIGELTSHLCHFGNKVTYEQTRSGCSIHSETNTKALANGQYQNELALNDFSWIMKLPNLQLSSLVVSLLLDGADREACSRRVQASLGSLETKEIYLGGICFNELTSILPHFKAGTLKEISLDLINKAIGDASQQERNAKPPPTAEKLWEVANTDQWKMAKKLIISWRSHTLMPMEYLYNFDRFELHLIRFNPEDAVKIRDVVCKSPTFEFGYFPAIDFFFPEEVARVFQPDYEGGSEGSIRYSNSTADFLISFEEEEFKIEKVSQN